MQKPLTFHLMHVFSLFLNAQIFPFSNFEQKTWTWSPRSALYLPIIFTLTYSFPVNLLHVWWTELLIIFLAVPVQYISYFHFKRTFPIYIFSIKHQLSSPGLDRFRFSEVSSSRFFFCQWGSLLISVPSGFSITLPIFCV